MKKCGMPLPTKLLLALWVVALPLAGVIEAEREATPEDTARSMYEKAHSAEEVAAALRQTHQLGSGETAVRLKDVGYHANEVAAALQQVYRASGGTTARNLAAARFASTDIGRSLKTAYRATDRETASYMKTAGLGAEAIGRTLQTSYQMSDFDAAVLLESSGFKTEVVGEALMTVYKANFTTIYTVLAQMDKPPSKIGAVLWKLYEDPVLYRAQMLNDAKVSAMEAIQALMEEYANAINIIIAAQALKTVGYPASGIAAALFSALGNDATSQIVAGMMMDDLGYSAEEVIEAIFNSLQQGIYTELAGMSLLLEELKAQVPNLHQMAAATMKSLNVALADVISVLDGAGFSVEEQAKAPMQAGYDNLAVAQEIRLRHAEVDAEEMAQWMHDAGATTLETAQVLYHQFAITEVPSLVEFLLVSGSSVLSIISDVNYLNYLVAMDIIYNLAMPSTISLLVGASSETTVMAAFDSETSLTNTEIVEAMKDYGSTAATVAAGIHDGLQKGATDAANYMEAAGYSCKSVASILHSEYDKSASQTVDILIDVGYGQSSVVSATKSVFNMTTTQVMQLIGD